MQFSKRIERMETSIFSHMNTLKNQVEAKKGIKVINLGIGSPDRPPLNAIRQAISESVMGDDEYRYPLTDGTESLRIAIANWYLDRFNVRLDHEKEVLVLMGSQDGLAHVCQAILDPGDIALIPDPGYPVYTAGVILADAIKYPLALTQENNFFPKYEDIPEEICKMAKMMFLNYPGNPIPAPGTLEFFKETVRFADENSIIVCHDNAYSELAYDGFLPPSFLQVEGAKDVGVEFHSFSKTFNMAGCRIGFVVGNSKVITALTNVKANIDYGVFLPIQHAAEVALKNYKEWVANNCVLYQRRRDILISGLKSLGWNVDKPKASMFLWAQLPQGHSSSQHFAEQLLEEAGVLLIPGTAFGKHGEGYVRIALVQEEDLLLEAVHRIKSFLK
ncbi:aminotransferase class I/II-fold pyridoxal phosphate-dependent enzyme [Desulfitibacter alkalitolerans]|uniref:aminotransferase class I/II-fold pyridoxal phosphate-dependent enzyme n=1 Tax=Desulfitibacter alkalitolerans TaxID=264641 RepID=UPI00048305CE|nr:aminotransferase class I/II-fold pyridoxal phosphate-dependent enzyme [Desulfitibacter alkalitolerans]